MVGLSSIFFLQAVYPIILKNYDTGHDHVFLKHWFKTFNVQNNECQDKAVSIDR